MLTDQIPAVSAPPDFDNLLAVLRKEVPQRPTLFEFFLNGPLYARLAGASAPPRDTTLADFWVSLNGFKNAGYDYATLGIPGFEFAAGAARHEKTRSINEGAVITDRASFDAYQWPDPDKADYGILDRISRELPRGMKIVVCGPCGVLENAIRLVGYETLCYLVLDDRQLAGDVFEEVGKRLVAYYRRCAAHPAVGAIIGNDDWGFKSQPMFSPADMRRFVFPYHKQIVAAAHARGKPAILHSCGCLASVMDDVIDDLRYDGKHSYEDAIQPVEEAYDMYHKRIAILGGIDVDFVCRAKPEQVYQRSKAMLKRAARDGGYALGTGNSVPEYVPDQAYFAMIRAAIEDR